MTSEVAPHSAPSAPQEPSARLVREWAACGIVAAAARFIPVPLLDDLVRERATRLAVVRTLRAHGRGYDADWVEPMYAGVEGASGGVGRYLRSVPRRVLLFPIRKYVAIFGAVKGVPTDVMTVVLISRSLHRELERGRLAGDGKADDGKAGDGKAGDGKAGDGKKKVEEDAYALRRAVDKTLDRMDLRLLSGAVGESLSRGKALTQAAVERARALVKRGDAGDDDQELGQDDDGEVGVAAGSVAGALQRKDVVGVLAEYDARVDKLLGH